MIKIRTFFDCIVPNENKITEYFQITEKKFMSIFFPHIKNYEFVNLNEKSDICIVDIQHTDNSKLRNDELNIIVCVENLSVGRTHYQHFNKFGRVNPKIDYYFYNDISKLDKNKKMIPNVLMRIKYFNSIFNDYKFIRENTPFHKKKFCLFTSRNLLNENKRKILNELFRFGKIDYIHDFPQLKNTSCYNSNELLTLFNQYKFIICFENSNTNGYITEKIFNVFLSGSIPIYDGSPDINDFLNINSFIPYNKDCINKVMKLNENEKMYNMIVNYPKIKNEKMEEIEECIDYVSKINLKNNYYL